jgi:hypothetical protein
VAKRIELSDAELALLLDSLEEAAFFRDARSRVVDSAVRRQARRRDPAGVPSRSDSGDEHRDRMAAYQALRAKLREAGQA